MGWRDAPVVGASWQSAPIVEQDQEKIDPVKAALISGGRWLDRRASGLRAAVPEPVRNVIDAANTKLGLAPPPSIDPATVAENERIFAGLEKTNPVSTFIGDVVPSLATVNPAAMAVVAGMEYGTPSERAFRAGSAFAGGKAGEYIGGKLAAEAGRRAAAAPAAATGDDAVRTATIKAAQDAGYVFPPAQINPTIINRAAEGAAGKLTTAQNAAAKNQGLTNAGLRRDLRLPADAPLVPETLQEVRRAAYVKGYEPIKAFGEVRADKTYNDSVMLLINDYAAKSGDMKTLRNPQIEALIDDVTKTKFDSSNIVELLRGLREEGFANKVFTNSAQTKNLGNVQLKAADAIESLLERNLSRAGQKALLDEFRDSRRLIAKAFTAEKVINPATGNARADKLASMFLRGKPLDGEMLTAGRTAAAFPASMKEITTSLPQVSPLDYLAGIFGSSAGADAAIGLPFVRPMVRAGILSGPYQKAMVNTPKADADVLSLFSADQDKMRRIGGLLGMTALQSFQ